MLKTLSRLLRLFWLCLVVLMFTITAFGPSHSLSAQHDWPKTTPWQGRDFSEGWAGVCYQGGPRTCAYFDRQGKLALMTDFTVARDFYGGRAAVGNGQNYGFIDKSGKMLVPLRFGQVGDFSEGLAAVVSGGKWGYINRQGRVVIPLQFAWAGEFHDGVAVVGAAPDREQGLILNKQGRVVRSFLTHSGLPEGFRHGRLAAEGLLQFSEGLIPAANLQKKVGYLNTKGKVVIPYMFEDADDFSEGLAAVRSPGFIGYINAQGKKVIRLKSDGIPYPSPFGEGLALVRYGLEAGPYAPCEYINQRGRSLVKIGEYYPQNTPKAADKKESSYLAFSSYTPPSCADFHEGLAQIELGSKRHGKYFVDKKGAKAFQLQWPSVSARDFHEGRAHLRFAAPDQTGGKISKQGDAYIDRAGRIVFQSLAVSYCQQHRKHGCE
jgi:WG containing repeat